MTPIQGTAAQRCAAVPFLRPKRVRKGFFGAFQGDSMHFRGHSRRIALLLPPFVVYYKHRAVLCSICHSRNSYRAENRPVTANRAVFCFLRVRVVHRVVSAHLRGDSCPKPSKAGKTWYTGYNKSARLGGRLKRRGSYAKTAHQHGSGAEHGTDRNAAARWAVESGLLPDMGEGAFMPGKRVTKVQVIRAWNRLKKLGLAK